MKYLIIGNGIAGMEAALTIRKHNREDEITIISKSKYLHYYRYNIPKYIAEEVTTLLSLEEMTVYKEDFYEQRDIIDVLHTEIIDINKSKMFVSDNQDHKYNYTKLLIAIGGETQLPDLKKNNLDGIFTLHGISDANKIKSYLKNIKTLFIVGSGFLGLETASALSSKNIEISIIEKERQILPYELDEKSATFVQKLLEKKGYNFILNNNINSFSGKENRLKSVTLKNKERREIEAIIFCTGITPNIELAEQSNIKTNKGIIVNEYLQTSQKNVYAAGDVIEYDNKLRNNWKMAKYQGYIAGMNMLEKQIKYDPPALEIYSQISGISIYKYGDILNVPADCKILEREKKNSYYKLIIIDDKPSAILIINDKEAVETAQKVILDNTLIEDFINIFN